MVVNLRLRRLSRLKEVRVDVIAIPKEGHYAPL